jgi:hypothetical protein
MVEDLFLVKARARTAREVGLALRDGGLLVKVTYWDYWEEIDRWRLRVLLAVPMSSQDFYFKIVELSRAGLMPEGADLGELSPTFPGDERADALVRASRQLHKPGYHVKNALLDNAFFDEAVLGYVADDYQPAPAPERARA